MIASEQTVSALRSQAQRIFFGVDEGAALAVIAEIVAEILRPHDPEIRIGMVEVFGREIVGILEGEEPQP